MVKKKVPKASSADALKDQGNKAFISGKYSEAVSLYSKAIEMQPNHVYFANRANAYLEMDENEKCLGDCEAAISLDKTYFKAFYRKALALYNLEKHDEALKVLGEAKQLEDSDLVPKLT